MDAVTRIVLVDDHTILREGLRQLFALESDLEVVGEARSAAEGVRVVRTTQPTLAITDLAMPGGSGLQMICELRIACAGVRVLLLTAYCYDEVIVAALSAGADGCVSKDASLGELLQAIRCVSAGRKYVSERLAARLVSGDLRPNYSASDSRTGARHVNAWCWRETHSAHPARQSPRRCASASMRSRITT